MHLRHPLNRSGLLALLEQWALAENEHAPCDAAAQWSQWLSPIDAIRLNSALSAIERASFPAVPGVRGRDCTALEALFEKAMSETIGMMVGKSAPSKPPRGRADSAPTGDPAPAEPVDFGVHGQRYLALQKQMSVRLGALRAQMRERLSGASPALQQLAALDAAMEQVVSAHEQRLWASLPLWLEKRHAQLRKAHAQLPDADGTADARLAVQQPGGWLFTFEQDMRALLLAEMQARLQPHRGLLEAARNDDR